MTKTIAFVLFILTGVRAIARHQPPELPGAPPPPAQYIEMKSDDGGTTATADIIEARNELSAAGATPNGVNNKTYCCGVGTAVGCGGPDWTPIILQFNAAANSVNVTVSIDFSVSNCPAEKTAVKGTSLTFPGLASGTDCLGEMLRNTGALTGDLQASYDPMTDTVEFDVDSEGVTAMLTVC